MRTPCAGSLQPPPVVKIARLLLILLPSFPSTRHVDIEYCMARRDPRGAQEYKTGQAVAAWVANQRTLEGGQLSQGGPSLLPAPLPSLTGDPSWRGSLSKTRPPTTTSMRIGGGRGASTLTYCSCGASNLSARLPPAGWCHRTSHGGWMHEGLSQLGKGGRGVPARKLKSVYYP